MFLLPIAAALALLALFSWVYLHQPNNALLLKPPKSTESTTAKILPVPAIFHTTEPVEETHTVSATTVTHHLVEEAELDQEAGEVVVNEENVVPEKIETGSVNEALMTDDVDSTIQWNSKMMEFLSAQFENIKNMFEHLADASFKHGNALEHWEAIIMPYLIYVQTIIIERYEQMYEMLVPVLIHRYQQICGVFVSVIHHLSHNNVLAKGAQTARILYTKYFSDFVQDTLLPRINYGIVAIQSVWDQIHIPSFSVESDDTRVWISTTIHSCMNQMQSIPYLNKASLSRGYLIVVSYFTQYVLPVLLPLVNRFHHFFWNISSEVVEFMEHHVNVQDMDTHSVVVIVVGAVVGVVLLSGQSYPLIHPFRNLL